WGRRSLPPVLGRVERVPQRLLLVVGQQQEQNASRRLADRDGGRKGGRRGRIVVVAGWRQPFHGVLKVQDRQSDLPQVVLTAHPGRGLTHFLDGRQQQTNQHGNDGDHHEQLNERKRGTLAKHNAPRKQEESVGRVGSAAGRVGGQGRQVASQPGV